MQVSWHTVLLLLLLPGGGCGQAHKQGAVMRGTEVVTTWIEAIERVPPQGYLPVSDFETLPKLVRGDSTMWAERFLKPEASPHARGATVQWEAHLSTADTPDILRHRLRVGPYGLDIAETINFMLIRVIQTPRLLELGEEARPAAVRAAALAILNLQDSEHTWVFQLPARIVDGVLFSTNPDADPLHLPSWKDRADGGVHRQTLFFLCYKKFFDRAGFRDIQRWFDESWRSHARR